jgi:hypothetical protein
MLYTLKKLIPLLIILSFSIESIGIDYPLYLVRQSHHSSNHAEQSRVANRSRLSEDTLRPVATGLSSLNPFVSKSSSDGNKATLRDITKHPLKMGLLLVDDWESSNKKTAKWLWNELKKYGIEITRQPTEIIPYWVSDNGEFHFGGKGIDDPGAFVGKLINEGFIKPKNRAYGQYVWAKSRLEKEDLDNSSLNGAEKREAMKHFASAHARAYIKGSVLDAASDNFIPLALAGGKYNACMKDILKILIEMLKDSTLAPIYLLNYEPAINLDPESGQTKAEARQKLAEILESIGLPYCLCIDGKKTNSYDDSVIPRIILDIYTGRDAFKKYFSSQWLFVNSVFGVTEVAGRHIPCNWETAVRGSLSRMESADQQPSKRFAIFDLDGTLVRGVDGDIIKEGTVSCLDALKDSSMALTLATARHRFMLSQDLENLGLNRFFTDEQTYDRSDLKMRSTDQFMEVKSYKHIVKKLGIEDPARQLIVVGDHERDLPIDIPGVVFIQTWSEQDIKILPNIFRLLSDLGKGHYANEFDELFKQGQPVGIRKDINSDVISRPAVVYPFEGVELILDRYIIAEGRPIPRLRWHAGEANNWIIRKNTSLKTSSAGIKKQFCDDSMYSAYLVKDALTLKSIDQAA